MLPYERIICPTDFSEPSLRALDAAAELAEHFKAKIYLIHVVHPIPPVAAPEEPFNQNVNTSHLDVNTYNNRLYEAKLKNLHRLREERMPDALDSEFIVPQGSPSEEIVNAAADVGANLIVIATHGTRGWSRHLFGTVTERVIREAPCPVLVIGRQQ